MALEQQLRVPGPTPLHERVVRSQSRPMINHRGPEFAALMAEVDPMTIQVAFNADNSGTASATLLTNEL